MKQKIGFFVRKTASGETVQQMLPLVDVAVALITSGDRILAVYNEKWGAFTLPMTKRRTWDSPDKSKEGDGEEDWADAAVRAAAEWVGRTVVDDPVFLQDVAEFQQSDRDDKWKRYHLQAFRVTVERNAPLPPGKTAEWLTVSQWLDERRRPISPTARHVVAELEQNGKV